MVATRRPARKPGPQAADERMLVEAAQSDPAKFDALYDLNFERVYAFLASRVRDRATAEDLTSEVFHKALANLPRYEWRGVPFAAWLLRIPATAICKLLSCAPSSTARSCSTWWGSFQRFRSGWCTSDLWNNGV